MADERVASAVRNWAPRFIANGIDYNDYLAATSRIEEWKDWCRVFSELGDKHYGLGEDAVREGRTLSAAQHYFQASMAYHFGKYMFVDYPDERLQASRRAQESYRLSAKLWPGVVEHVSIPGPSGLIIPGILRKPEHQSCPPIVVLIPGLDSVKEELHRYGDDFLSRGMAVLAIDGPGQGELEDAGVPMWPNYEAIVSAVVDYTESRGDLDRERIGVMGVSVGGYYAARAAACEPRIKATIESGGAYCLADDFDTVPLLTRQAFIARSGKGSAEEARDYLLQFTLEGLLSQLSHPMLVIHGEHDRLFPVEDSPQHIADEAGEKAELWVVKGGNHLVNNMPYLVRTRQADWMMQQLTSDSI
ncbi:alpha/beta hydrolase family protein [Alicyclobacillus sp. ALC3]|uniref:alpha/beta hydrolase family protein n=1 Tax=Alicyclobacillus sp. ALC3 TaxID=2796143 RepID=UPI0023793EC8|nr:alpha/beta fold hydrolase [Alicyclobacillus sp. ALC3]WDL97578.1 alpha/beta fold hydrolase [Alicyclobacillus sp. ALC3]